MEIASTGIQETKRRKRRNKPSNISINIRIPKIPPKISINISKYPAYEQHSALFYMCDSELLILYHSSKPIQWIFSKHWPSGPMLSISWNVRSCVCLFTFEVRFKFLFAPNSQSQMSKVIKDSESLGQSNEKKWSQIWNFFTNKGCKIAAQTKVCFWANFALLIRIFWYWCFSLPLTVFCPYFPKSNVQTFLIFGILGEK